MRVLIVSQYFWPETFLINAVVARLVAEGVEVTVVTGKPNYPEGRIMDGYRAWGVVREAYQGAEVLRVPLVPRGQDSRVGLALNYLSFIVAGSLVAPWMLQGRRFDAIFVYAPSPLVQAYVGLVLKRLKRAPLLLWVQDLWPESLTATNAVRNRGLLTMVRRAVCQIYRGTDRILIQSQAFRAPIQRLVPEHAEIHYLPNSLPEDPITTPTTPQASALAAQIGAGFSVVFAGNLGQAQGLDTVLEAADLLRDTPDVTFYLVGSGRGEESLRQQIGQRGLTNVVLPGRFAASDMPAILSQALALLVSLRPDPIFSYTIPNKLQTYLATGRPIIASLDGEGARILADAQAGLACPAGDAQALADAVRQMRSCSESEIDAMSAAGRAYFEAHFSLQSLTTHLISHLEQASAAKKEAAI